MPRHRIFPAIVCLLLSLSLGGCITAPKLTGDQQLELIRRLGEYGCGGSINIEAGGETGQLGGGAHAGFQFNGECPKRTPPAPPT